MTDDKPTPAPATTGPRTAAFTLSTPTDASPDPLIELGERIVAELGDTRTNNTLVRWLAHYTARLVHAADAARAAGAPDAEVRNADARDAILHLWQARTAWPTGWPPRHAVAVAQLLADVPALDDQTGTWHRSTVLGTLQDIHLHVLGTIVDLATAGNIDVEAGWLDRFGDALTVDEATMLRRVADLPRRMDALRTWRERRLDNEQDELESATATHVLLELADAYRNAVVGLLDRATIADDDKDQ